MDHDIDVNVVLYQQAEHNVRKAYQNGEFNGIKELPAFPEAVEMEYKRLQGLHQPVPAVYANVKKGRDGAQYTRQQKGHSLLLHLTLGAIVLWIPAIYITASPNHYWHS